MEYLEGDTLAQRLEKGALPLDQALKTAVELATSLVGGTVIGMLVWSFTRSASPVPLSRGAAADPMMALTFTGVV
jgi:hypothetical protein